jgi:hypothetical protein
MQEVQQFNKKFYTNTTKVYQDAFIIKHTSSCSIKRRRPRTGENKTRTCSVKYFVKIYDSNTIVPVCAKAFSQILKVSNFRIRSLTKKEHKQGVLPKENRGGDHKTKKYLKKKKAVITFIKKYRCLESHYCRSHSIRLYLSSDLSIRKMYKQYQLETQENLKVKESYFRQIFKTNFNIGFGTPRTDVCSTCLSNNNKIKAEQNLEVKLKLMKQQRIHTLRAKAFYDN